MVRTRAGGPGVEQGGAKMAPGPVLRAPIRWSPHPVVSLRTDPFFALHTGQDRVEWTQFDGNISYASEDHWTLLTQFGVTVGPEVSPWPDAKIIPYAGSQLGFAWAQHWHSFKGASAKKGNQADPIAGHDDSYSTDEHLSGTFLMAA